MTTIGEQIFTSIWRTYMGSYSYPNRGHPTIKTVIGCFVGASWSGFEVGDMLYMRYDPEFDENAVVVMACIRNDMLDKSKWWENIDTVKTKRMFRGIINERGYLEFKYEAVSEIPDAP